eukprot:CAMPEP_0117447086 /NCGR_PEP_ID=MMETSP0759-20121206/6684_1 /TAXON_ID=63605 /ORGANISM="Percolomonas cosmopolitus, Strain WS" /LENGTH=591 /DNA_ID=CAMNT_0005239391 /DNA_START=7 /DNA_END=1782 /DNA_ORIENTATION=+
MSSRSSRHPPEEDLLPPALPQRTETLLPPQPTSAGSNTNASSSSSGQPLSLNFRSIMRNFDFGGREHGGGVREHNQQAPSNHGDQFFDNSANHDNSIDVHDDDDSMSAAAPQNATHTPLLLLSNTPPSSSLSKSIQLLMYILTSSYTILLCCVFLFFVCVAYIATILVLNGKLRDNLPVDVYERAQYMARFKVPLLDTHNDWPNRVDRLERMLGYELDLRREMNETERGIYEALGEDLHTDIPRMRQGELRAQFWSIFASCHAKDPVQEAIRQFETVYQLLERYNDEMVYASKAEDVWNYYLKDNRIVSLMGVEGGHMLGLGDYHQIVRVLQTFYRLGARYMTLTHSCDTHWAKNHESTNATKPGLTKLGERIVREMNRMGMMVDLAHTHPDTMRQVLDISEAPIIFSHSSVWELCHSTRNLPNDIIDLVAQKHGVIMINYFSLYISEPSRVKFAEIFAEHTELPYTERIKLFQQWEEANPDKRATIQMVCDHIDYIRQRTGNTKNIGIGADYDGVMSLPVGLEDVSKHYHLGAELYKRGYSDDEIRDIFGGNLLSVMKEVENVAERMRERSGTQNRVEQYGIEDLGKAEL